ncbi:MAG: hypothetical protein FJZ01_08185 [Candidatus Sericytochromatia bacterium]|nr:hypothetical protein [Candidatus Tanganyikabacteria bacterium]
MPRKAHHDAGQAGSGLSLEEIEASRVDLGEIEPPPEAADQFERAIATAERQLEEARVSFRWRPDSLDVVKRAAAKVGVPYQTYMKVVTYQRALADLSEPPEPGTGKPPRQQRRA